MSDISDVTNLIGEIDEAKERLGALRSKYDDLTQLAGAYDGADDVNYGSHLAQLDRELDGVGNALEGLGQEAEAHLEGLRRLSKDF